MGGPDHIYVYAIFGKVDSCQLVIFQVHATHHPVMFQEYVQGINEIVFAVLNCQTPTLSE